MLSAKLVTTVFGATFILVGLFGFVPNPIVSPEGMFAVNAMHNAVHIVTGLAFLAGGQLGYARKTVLGIGAGYVVVTIAGFLTTGNMLLGLIHINGPDRWLHAFLAIAILVAGAIAQPDTEPASRTTKTA